MDKLEPIIKNRFWILAGLVVPLAMYGFFSANGKLKAATSSREEELEKVLRDIPPGSTNANKKYSEGMQKINTVYSKTVEDSIFGIWNKQQERMTWPPVVSQYVPPVFLGEFSFEGVVAYQEAYERLMRDLQARVEPVMPLEQKTGPTGLGALQPSGPEELADVPWKQKVILAASIPQARFGTMRATSEEIWNAQIDIWLLRLLFDAVARLNEDKDSATEAILRRIDTLQLVGGDGQPVVTGGGSSGNGDGSSGYGNEMYEGSQGGGGNSGYGGGATSLGATSVAIAFNPAQEFGSAADAGDAGDSDSQQSSYSEMSGTLGGNENQLRYIADEEGKPYLERGFYMSVIIMQDKIPDFLVELANSEWPVRVTRFHVGKNPYYTGATTSSSPYGNSYGDSSFSSEGAMDSFSGRGSAGYGTESSFGGVGPTTPGIEGVGGLTTNLPKMATDAMQHPNLVQMDLCGVITMYKQPQSIIDAIENGESLTESAVPPVGEEPNSPQAGDDPNSTPAEGVPSADPNQVAPGADNASPATTTDETTAPANEQPAGSAATPGSETTPPAENSPNTLELENL